MQSLPKVKTLEREVARLRALAYRDELTGLLNRRGFSDLAAKLFSEVRWSARHKDHRKNVRIQSFSILFMDLDHFKAINDRYGYDAGDKALRHIAGILTERVRDIDVVGRWGGEEFVIALAGADERAATQVAEDIRRMAEEYPVRYRAKKIPVTLSIGVAGFRKETTLGALIAHADAAMYRAKRAGRNRVAASFR